jgi:hypothetical protein
MIYRCIKVQHKPIKRLKKGFKKKGAKKPKCALVWRIGLSGVPPDSVRCTRTVQLRTLHLRVSQASLRYNSPDCPVCHRTVRCTSGATALQRNGRLHSAPVNATVRGRSQQRSKAHQTVNNVCPVRHRTVQHHQKTKLRRSKPPEP